MNISDFLQHSIFPFYIATFTICGTPQRAPQLSLELKYKLKQKYSIKSESSFTLPL